MILTKKQLALIERVSEAMEAENNGDNGVKDMLEWDEVCAALNLLVKIAKGV